MRDGLGRVARVAIVGATSDIGQAVAHRLDAGGVEQIVLAGRALDQIDVLASALKASTQVVRLDVTDLGSHETTFAKMFDVADLDLVIVTAGLLVSDPSATEATEMAMTNYVGTLSVIQHVGNAMVAQGHGQIVVLSSAGVTRPRPANYLYGSTKAAIDFAARGMAQAFQGQAVTITIVRPGFVHTKMTEGLRPTPLSSTAEEVAEAIHGAMINRKDGVIWVPSQIRWLAWLLALLPTSALRRLSG